MSSSTSSYPSQHHIMGVYNRAPLAFERGRGARAVSTTGDEYLDCVAGIATCGLGHAHPVWSTRWKTQGEKLWHVSNIYHDPRAGRAGRQAVRGHLRRRGVLHQFGHRGDRVRPEGRPPLPRGQRPARAGRHHRLRRLVPRPLATRRSTPRATPATWTGFGPRLPGYVQLPFGDWDALKAAIGPTSRRDHQSRCRARAGRAP